jgi:hypothetical protein
MQRNKKTYNPDGLATGKPIALRLMPNELKQAERLAKKSGYSRSFLARRLFLIGLESFTKSGESASNKDTVEAKAA